jgi:serine/threonine-protein kinase HipA
MARKPSLPPLETYLNGRLVGKLRKESSGAVEFRYDANWLAWENAIPVSLSLPLREDRYTGAPVLAVFENLLPDNDAIRRRLAERAHAQGADAYSLLAAVGRDCIGALQFIPEGTAQGGGSGGIDGRPVNDDEIANIIANLGRNPLGVGDDREFRISLAGAQEKTALLYWQGGWRVPHGTTPTTHILKPQIGQVGNGVDLSRSVENEHLCLLLAAALGLPAAKSEIKDFAGRRVLVVERFDRRWTETGRLLRLPQEDCCQALSVPPTRKYESEGGPGIRAITNLLLGSDDPDEDRRLFFRAQIVFWLIAATDGHAKNFSIHLYPGGRFRLTPFYDIVSTQPNFDAHQIRLNQMRLAMAVGDKRHYALAEINGRHFVQTAKLCGLPERTTQATIQQLGDQGKEAIDAESEKLPKEFPGEIAESITKAAKHRLELLSTK